MKKVLIVKYDGIGDYLFIRMFWEQLHNFSKTNNISLNFLCANRFENLVNKYDYSFFENCFCINAKNITKGFLKEKIFFLIPKYRKRLYKANSLKILKQKTFDFGINTQFSRYEMINDILKNLQVKRKYVIYKEESSKYLNDYDEIIKIPLDKFILEIYRTYFSAIFGKKFNIPSLQLPFTITEAKKTAFSILNKEKYIVFVPFSAGRGKNWSINNFIKVADEISKISDKKIVLLGGGSNVKKEELLQIKNFVNTNNIIDLFNKTDLETAMHIAAAAEYALTVDTSLMHCALIGGAETVCLSSGFAKKTYVEYPPEYNVKQTIFYPEINSTDINLISYEKVIAHIMSNWKL